MTAQAGALGFAPTVTVAPANPEAAKYAQLWQRDEYRAVAPGEHVAPVFVQTARPRPGATVIDFGYCTLSTAAFTVTSGNTLTIAPNASGVFTLA